MQVSEIGAPGAVVAEQAVWPEPACAMVSHRAGLEGSFRFQLACGQRARVPASTCVSVSSGSLGPPPAWQVKFQQQPGTATRSAFFTPRKAAAGGQCCFLHTFLQTS